MMDDATKTLLNSISLASCDVSELRLNNHRLLRIRSKLTKLPWHCCGNEKSGHIARPSAICNTWNEILMLWKTRSKSQFNAHFLYGKLVFWSTWKLLGDCILPVLDFHNAHVGNLSFELQVVTRYSEIEIKLWKADSIEFVYRILT